MSEVITGAAVEAACMAYMGADDDAVAGVVEMRAALEAALPHIMNYEISRLRAELDSLRVDAMRYRWLRDRPWLDNHELARVIQMQKNALWDERIDAAMGADA